MQTAAVRIEQDEMTGTGTIGKIVAKGKANGGTLTCGELIEAFGVRSMTPDDMDGLYQCLSDESIEIVDDTAVGEAREDDVLEPVDDADKFCAWCLRDFSYEGQTVMMAPASGFYVTPGYGRNEVRIAYVLERDELARALDVLEAALTTYRDRWNKR